MTFEYVLLLVLVLTYMDSTLSTEPQNKQPCTDFPSCHFIATRMFENYCDRTTMKKMCPTYCNSKCKNTVPSTTVSQINSRIMPNNPKILSTTSKYDEIYFETTDSTTIVIPVQTSAALATTDLIEAESSTTQPMKIIYNDILTTISSKYFTHLSSPSLSSSFESDEITKNPTSVFVPLFEAGFIHRVVVTSSRNECNYRRAQICRRESCAIDSIWCPETNDVPKELIEFHFNNYYDIFMIETQGRVFTNETVTQFLFQYLNQSSSVMTSKIFKTSGSNSHKINKFMFEQPIRTRYVRITPIEYVVSIAMRFEIYSKGILYDENE